MACTLPWPHCSEPPRLLPGEVHLWSASLAADDEQYRYYQSCMNPEEMARANRYAMATSRTRFICARAILKLLLSRYIGKNPAEISFRLGPLGKPYLPPASGNFLQFNSTDTEEEALFAFCLDAEIGVDIEYKTRKVNHAIIAHRKLTEQEYSYYRALPASQRRLFFLSVWTRKEAYGKAIGVGIKYRLNEVNLIDENQSPRISIRDDAGVVWEIVQIEPAADLVASVVTENTGWNFRYYRLPLDAYRLFTVDHR